jgi:hypothetical protein
MENLKYYKTLFIIAGIWNLGAGVLCWLGTVLMPDLFFNMFGMPIPPTLFPFHAMFWFIIVLGVGYVIVSRDVTKNQGIVLIGALAKILFTLDCIITLLLKEANVMLLGTGVVDFIFAILFIEFLLKTKAMTSQSA